MPSTATSILDGLSTSVAVKAPCRTVATSNITLAGLQTISGYTTVENDRVLVVGQTTQADNGIYLASTGNWTRAKDADGTRDLVQGTRVIVRSTTADGIEYELTTANPITIGTTALVFTLRYGANATYDQTAGELAAGVIPVNTSKQPGEVLRYGDNTTPGTTNVVTHIQAAINSATDINARVYLRDDNAIGAPIIIGSSTQQSISIIGDGRVSTILRPNAASISATPENKNALIINKKDNGHLHLQSLRCFDASAYTGKFLYSVEGGGDDSLAQTLFSAVVDDCWFSFSTNNSGIFQGGFSNLSVTKCVFEATKDACFILEGAGNGDLMFIGNVMNFCYDSFIRQVDDGLAVNLLLIDGLHVYSHLRGRVIDLTEATNVNINNVQVEFSNDNVGDCGLIRLKDCSDVRVTNCTMSTESGTPRGDVGIDIINAVSATFENCKITADIGLRVQGTGAINLTFIGCDFIGCQHAFQQLSGTLSGQIRFINCRLNNSDEYGMLHQAGTPSFSIYVQGGEIINAGMGGITTSRNINIDTSGEVRFVGTRIGQDSGDADAACFVRADGAGLFRLTECPIVGTAPTSVVDASSTQSVEIVWERSADLTATKTFQLAAAATKVVADTQVQAGSMILFTPTNAAAATLMSGAKALYISARNAGVSFTVATADGTAAAGNENFVYRIIP
jgi:hypothetical protein